MREQSSSSLLLEVTHSGQSWTWSRFAAKTLMGKSMKKMYRTHCSLSRGTLMLCWSLSLKKQKTDSPMLLFGNDESWRCRRQVVTRPWKRKKKRGKLKYYHLSSPCMVLQQEESWHACAALLLWLHSIYFSSICKCLERFSVWIRNCLSIFFVTTLRLPSGVPHLTIKGVPLFTCFRDGFWLFRKRAPCWVLHITTAGSLWLDIGWSSRSLSILSLMSMLNRPVSLQQVSK